MDVKKAGAGQPPYQRSPPLLWLPLLAYAFEAHDGFG
jgi:hypothetical protein